MSRFYFILLLYNPCSTERPIDLNDLANDGFSWHRTKISTVKAVIYIISHNKELAFWDAIRLFLSQQVLP